MVAVNTNPPHILTNSGHQMPSAFIPFCSYGTNMEILGEFVENLTFPVCNKFTPSILDGQLCYELDIASVVKGSLSSEKGRQAGLMMILDYNLERQVVPARERVTRTEGGNGRETSMNLEIVPEAEQAAAKIYLHTLARNIGYGAGSYAMKALKKIVGTQGFLDMADKDKQCSVEQHEDCWRGHFLQEGAARCGCVPAALAPAWPQQVMGSHGLHCPVSW